MLAELSSFFVAFYSTLDHILFFFFFFFAFYSIFITRGSTVPLFGCTYLPLPSTIKFKTISIIFIYFYVKAVHCQSLCIQYYFVSFQGNATCNHYVMIRVSADVNHRSYEYRISIAHSVFEL
jgi:hypothetical protein